MRKSPLFAVYFVIFMDNFGFALVFTLFAPLLLNPEFHIVGSQVSVGTKNVLLALLFGIFPLSQFFGAPIIGDFADHYGRKKALYITILGSFVSYVLSGVAISCESYVFLLITRFIAGFFAGNLGICLAAIADLSPDEISRGKNYGFVTTLFGISWILSMVTGGYLADPSILKTFNPSFSFYITAVLTLLSFFAVLGFLNETNTHKQREKFDLIGGIHNINKAFSAPSVRDYYFVYFFWTMGWGLVIQWFAAFAMQKFDASTIAVTSWLIGIGLTWGFGSVVINPWLLKRTTSYPSALWGFVIATILVWSSALVPEYALFGISFLVASTFSAFTMSNVLNLISISSPVEIQGKALGLSQSTASCAWILTSILAAFIGKVDILWLYPAGAFIMTAGVIWLFSKGKKGSEI